MQIYLAFVDADLFARKHFSLSYKLESTLNQLSFIVK